MTTALPVIAVVLGTADLAVILTSDAPFSAFMVSVTSPAVGRALSAGVALAVFNALIVQLMFSGRLFFSLGRDKIFCATLNRVLVSVHGKSGAPRAATLAIGLIAASLCLLNTHLLLVFSSGLLTFTFGLACLAVLVGRAKRLTGQPGCWRSPLFPIAPLAGLGLAGGFCVANVFDGDAGRPSTLILAGVLIAALVWHHRVLKGRPGGWTPLVERDSLAPIPSSDRDL